MVKATIRRAEEQFAASQKKDKEFLKGKEKAKQEAREQLQKLRALRLAKEAADKEAAERQAAEKAAKTSGTKTKKAAD